MDRKERRAMQYERVKIRNRERARFISKYGKEFMHNKVIHHMWIPNKAEYTNIILFNSRDEHVEHHNTIKNMKQGGDNYVQQGKYNL